MSSTSRSRSLVQPRELMLLLAVYVGAFWTLRHSDLDRWYADSAALIFSPHPIGQTTSIVHFSTNSFFSWQWDPLIQLLVGGYGYLAYVTLQLFVFSLGLLCCFRRLCGVGEMRSSLLIAALGIPIALLLLFGIDVAVLGSLTWFPWLIFVLLRFADDTPPRSDSYLALCSLSLLMAFSLRTSVLLVVLLALLGVMAKAAHQPRRELFRVSLILLVPALLAVFFSQVPEFPDYPKDSHLVRGYGTSFGFQPNIGEAPPIPFLDREFIRRAYLPHAAFLLLMFLGLTVRELRGGNLNKSPTLSWCVLGVFLSGALILDSSLFAANVSQSAPLQSLSRIFPGFFYLACAPMIFAFSLVLLFFAIFSSGYRKATAASIVAILLLLSPFSSTSGLPRFFAENATEPLIEYRSVPESKREQARGMLNSPSFGIIREYGLGRLQSLTHYQNQRFVSVLEQGGSVRGLPLLEEGRGESRWTSRKGFQSGDEWLHVYLKSPLPLSGIRILTGEYFTDFPRGLRFSVKPSCLSDEATFGDYEVISDEPVHEGEVLFTTKGLPYFSQQYTAAAYLRPPQWVQCMLIQQTGKDPNYDWTVTEIQVAVASG